MRLNKHMREGVVENAVLHTMSDRCRSYVNKERDVADAVLEAAIGEHAKAWRSLPESFSPMTSAIRLCVDPNVFALNFYKRVPEEALCEIWIDRATHFPVEIRCVPAFLTHYVGSGPLFRLREGDELGARVIALREELSGLIRDCRILRNNLNKMVFEVQTVEALAKLWPEAERFIPKPQKKPENQVSIRGEDLMAMIAKAKAGGPLDKAA